MSPASGYLQRCSAIFQRAITIFDNILLLAHDEDDACAKFEKFIHRCATRNVQLKMQKTWLSFNSVKFFGYKVSPHRLPDNDPTHRLCVPCYPQTSGLQRQLPWQRHHPCGVPRLPGPFSSPSFLLARLPSITSAGGPLVVGLHGRQLAGPTTSPSTGGFRLSRYPLRPRGPVPHR